MSIKEIDINNTKILVSDDGTIWKPGYIHHHKDGRVFHYKQRKCKQFLSNTTGYYLVNINYQPLLVHRIIAEAFIPNPENLPCINHKDGNKKNNSISNLEWCTYSENNKHANRTGLKNDNHKVICIDTGEVFYSESEASRRLNVPLRKVSEICNGLANQTKGYHFRFYDSDL